MHRNVHLIAGLRHLHRRCCISEAAHWSTVIAVLRNIIIHSRFYDKLTAPQSQSCGESQLRQKQKHRECAHCPVGTVISARISCQLLLHKFAPTQLPPVYSSH